MATMNAEQQAKVIRLLDVRVEPSEPGRTPALEISGVVSDLALQDHLPDGDPSSIEA